MPLPGTNLEVIIMINMLMPLLFFFTDSLQFVIEPCWSLLLEVFPPMDKRSEVNAYHQVNLFSEIVKQLFQIATNLKVASENPIGITVTYLEPSLSLESKFSIGQLALHFLFRHPHHVSVSPPSTKQLPGKNQDDRLQVTLARI